MDDLIVLVVAVLFGRVVLIIVVMFCIAVRIVWGIDKVSVFIVVRDDTVASADFLGVKPMFGSVM